MNFALVAFFYSTNVQKISLNLVIFFIIISKNIFQCKKRMKNLIIALL